MSEKPKDQPQDKPIDRRKFFRMGLAELLKPLARAAAPLERAAEQIGKLEETIKAQQARQAANQKPRVVSLHVWLRPPGSLLEQKFLETCSRCGECVRACPAQCIIIDPTGAQGGGAPYIVADTRACAVCSSLKCMDVCPSGALVPTPLMEIDMGTAVWREETCLRETGQDCTICVDHCPLGSAAITVKNNEIVVNPHGCIGCGVCQQDCPTTPKSIRVIPIAAKTVGR